MGEVKVLDERQLVRIEAVHRGFLYQHLYATICLLRAQETGATAVIVERDEDVEVRLPDQWIYIQVKTRQHSLSNQDISDALSRFEMIRNLHEQGNRPKDPKFVIASNASPAKSLLELFKSKTWPVDVDLIWPDRKEPTDSVIPCPPRGVPEAFTECCALASRLQFAVLKPETLAWKLAGVVMLAASGSLPREKHQFTRDELPELFEQFLIQMQDFPEPPRFYRSQIDEPPLTSDAHVRIIVGFSGAGKTAWVAEAATHDTNHVAYFDIGDTPGSALASALTRELTVRIFGRSSGKLGEIILPGASGLDMLGTLSAHFAQEGLKVTMVIDNAHRLQASDLKLITDRASNIHFLILCQPGAVVEELEALLDVKAISLAGWNEDTIASVVAEKGCFADYRDCERLARLTGGLPLYVESAIEIASNAYGGSITKFCSEIEKQTHVVTTSQGIILQRVFETFPDQVKETVSILSLVDVPLKHEEAKQLLQGALDLDLRDATARLRALSRTGMTDLFSNGLIKIHDSVRILGQMHLAQMGEEFELKVRSTLREVIVASLKRDWSISKVSLLVRTLGQIGEFMVLVDLANDELFHEMGVWPEIEHFLVSITQDENSSPSAQFWALDGLVLHDLKEGNLNQSLKRIAAMKEVLDRHDFSEKEWLVWAMKQMIALSNIDDFKGVIKIIKEIEARLPDGAPHKRIFRYNRALAMFKLGRFHFAEKETKKLIDEYYGLIGITPDDVLARNPIELRPLLNDGLTLTDDLKHLADTLDLHAQVLQRIGKISPFLRIHAMKFYDLAHAHQSLIRVGQDLVEEFLSNNDFLGARQLLESNLIPTVHGYGLAAYVVPIRSLYAVVLAYCGEFDRADREMAYLAQYEGGLSPEHRLELRNQRAIIADLRQNGAPPQVQLEIPEFYKNLLAERQTSPPVKRKHTKVGRNELCPCGSGRKYKHCHGS